MGPSVAIPRYRWVTASCGRVVFNQDLGKPAAARSATTRRCARYVLRRLMIDRTTVSAIAVELGISWHTVNTIATGATAVAAAGPDRLAGVRIIGIDQHRWAPRNLRIRDAISPNSTTLNQSEDLDSDVRSCPSSRQSRSSSIDRASLDPEVMPELLEHDAFDLAA